MSEPDDSQPGDDVESDDMEFRDELEEEDENESPPYEEEEERHFDRMEQQPQYDLDLSFERDIDLLTKVKAKVMFNINRERQREELPIMYEDIILTSVSMQYATSIKTGSANEPYLKKLCEQLRNDADYKCCEITSDYEEDVMLNKNYQEKFFTETSYLFFEMDKEREIILDSSNTHVGIGLAGDRNSIAIVLLVAQRELAITHIDEASNVIQVKGKMLDFSVGICGVKICNAANGEYKEICTALHDKIDFNRQTKEFCVYLEMESNWKERRWIELWTRENPDTIGYRKPRKEKDKGGSFRHLKMKLRSLFILFPDQKYQECYNTELSAEEDRNKKIAISILEDIPQLNDQQEEKQEEQHSQESNQESEHSEDGEQEGGNKELNQKQNMSSNKEIKEELQLAIGEAKGTYDGLLDTNKMMQAKIKEIRDKNNMFIDKTSEASMNEHKYLNILAQVHQTRVELQETQNRYNRMSLQLQNKLNEKQSKCNDIKNAFQDLKREVAKKATYSRSEQPIKTQKIEDWEKRENKVTQELQNLRLQILRARNSYAKNQKILKKKQQLAEGLHLIDFEQLKIENQTLNEKIEQRNEDLHKLKKKTTSMVQILTHTREKLVYVQKMKEALEKESGGLEKSIQALRAQINATKESCEKLRENIQDAKQETEIVNSQQLVVDFKKRAQNIVKIEEQITRALGKEKQMKTIIDMYQRKIRKQGIVK